MTTNAPPLWRPVLAQGNAHDPAFWRPVLARHEALSLDSETDRETLARALAEAAQVDAGVPLDERVKASLERADWESMVRGLDTLRLELARVTRERDGWTETAAQQQRNAEYYAGLLDRVATLFGREAYVSDDGSVQDSPIRAKVPDMVERLKLAAIEAAAALAESDRARTDQLRRAMAHRAHIEDLVTLIAAAAPLAWAHGVDPRGAYEWERRAEALLRLKRTPDGG